MTEEFSPRTVALAGEALACCSEGQMLALLQRYFVDGTSLNARDTDSKKTKVAKALNQFKTISARVSSIPGWPEQFVRDVVEERFAGIDVTDHEAVVHLLSEDRRLLNALRGEGWDVRDGKIVRSLSQPPEIVQAESDLLAKLKSLGWRVAVTHLQSGITGYENSNWTAANSQFRSFLQDLCDQIAVALYPCQCANKRGGGEKRKVLQAKGFLSDYEGEFLSKLFAMLGEAGAHPGISDERTCRMRRFVTESVALYLLEKFEGSSNASI